MKMTTYDDAKHFLQDAQDWLEREESLNNMMLGLAIRLAGADKPPGKPAVMMTVAGSGGLEAAAVMTPPRGVVLYAPAEQATAALEALAVALQAGRHPVPECLGPSATALAFAQIWARTTGQNFARKMSQRIYELRKVVFPAGVSGTARLPNRSDTDLLADWTHRFSLEVSAGEQSDPKSARASVEELMAAGQKLIWEDRGQPVSMAAAQRPLPHGIAISRVYTPPEYRGHGYASACVAELSQRQLDTGRQFCCLYTDLANPTSNSIYQKIGYVPVADSSHYVFTLKRQAGPNM